MQNSNGEGIEVKIILLGESGVGKTCIINRYINNEYYSDNPSTLGSSFTLKEVIKDKKKYNVNVWDTTGQEKYYSITNLFIHGSDIVILVYAINSKTSFETLDFWYNSVQEKLGEDEYILAIVGSKSDLTDDEEVSEELARKFAKEKKAFFKLVSAKEDPTGINSLFNEVLDILIKSKYLDKRNISTVINKKDQNKKKKKKGFC